MKYLRRKIDDLLLDWKKGIDKKPLIVKGPRQVGKTESMFESSGIGVAGGYRFMTLEKHVMDTMKEWQIKIGSFDSNIRLYYPKVSLCRYLNWNMDMDNEQLSKSIEKYFAEEVKYLGNVTVSAEQDRFCILVGKEGCDYVEKKVPEPEFLARFLEVLKSQNMQDILNFFKEYARQHGTTCITTQEDEEGLETVVFFENEDVEPYVYFLDQNEFGITYHRFSKDDYMDLG